ncbi:MAG: Asp-tRNA(Asn)/Glu-tRNA(Gln) amidotransferase subunit GatC [Betaproteobacteria bacterium]|nr:Asp-tRNA(Asn)/Glu-tRNA(Gln) amidotransferase subunit GatC [Betaproteobacteria bacterium]
MSLSLQDVERVARLARIAVTADEALAWQQQLNGVFGLIASMQAVDTHDIMPMAHALDVSQRMREDTVTECDQREKFLALAPQSAEGLYLVPQVIE